VIRISDLEFQLKFCRVPVNEWHHIIGSVLFVCFAGLVIDDAKFDISNFDFGSLLRSICGDALPIVIVFVIVM
jgi:hypothetical protein